MPAIYGRYRLEMAIIRAIGNRIEYHHDSTHQACIHVEGNFSCYGERMKVRQLTRIYKCWHDFGLAPIIAGVSYDNDRKARSRVRLSLAQLQVLKDMIELEPDLFLDEARDIFFHRGGPHCSISTIFRALKQMGFTRKVLQRKAAQRMEFDRMMWHHELDMSVTHLHQLLLLDESSKDRNAARRKYGRSRHGAPQAVKELFNMDTRYTFLGAGDCYGFVFDACETIMHKPDGKKESEPVDTERYVEYFREKVHPLLGNFVRKEVSNCFQMETFVYQLFWEKNFFFFLGRLIPSTC